MQDDKRKEKTMVALKKFLCVNVRVLLAAECVGEFSVVAKTLPSLVLLHFVSKLSVDIYEVTTQDRGRLTLSSESPVRQNPSTCTAPCLYTSSSWANLRHLVNNPRSGARGLLTRWRCNCVQFCLGFLMLAEFFHNGPSNALH